MLTVKKSLIASVLCAVTSVGFVMNVSAQETDNEKITEHSLEGIIVEGYADVLPGGIGKY